MESQSSSLQIKKFPIRWMRSELLQYLLILVFILGAFYFLSSTKYYTEYLQIPISSISAKISALILSIVGIPTTVQSVLISFNGDSVSISKGCDGIAPMLLVSLAILFFPGQKMNRKLSGIIVIVSILFILNLIRIISLVLSKMYIPSLFDFLHIEFWQIAFILISSLLFLRWLTQIQVDAKI